MTRMSRDKGSGFERAVVDLAKAHGFTGAHRTFYQPTETGADIAGIPGLAVECKRAETVRLRDWWKQAAAAAGRDAPCVALRWNHGPALAVVELDELFALWAARSTT